MSRLLSLLYGAACYAVFLATFLYAIGFVTGVGVPRHIDNGLTTALPWAVLVNVVLLSVFALQHSVMARPAFKRVWTRLVPAPIERSTYVLASSLALALVFWQWNALPTPVWTVEHDALRWSIHALCAVGWLLVLVSTFLISHFDLFGLSQVWRHARGIRAPDEAPFVVRALYRLVRHPIMLGFLIAFWATPSMSAGHLLFAVVTSAYIFVAVKFLEERDLVAHHGDAYRAYQRQVPMLLPWRGVRPASSNEDARDTGSALLPPRPLR